jgi:hypothetical protein
MSWLPDDLKHASGGERVDDLASDVLKLTHEALNRFPEMKKRHMFIAGGAAVSSALLVAAGVAIMRRIRSGQKPEQAVNEVTEEELEGLRLVKRTPYRPGNHNGTTPDEPEPGTEEATTGPAAASD